MLRDVFQLVTGYENFGVISMFIFALFFTLVVVHTFSMKKKEVDEFSNIPFDDSTKDQRSN
jgi:cbb3-type cytochrome oxidase subunit 3